jgi:hypothetical protein
MRFFLVATVLAASCATTAMGRANDDLFSEVAMESVFATPTATSEKSVASPSTVKQIDRITGTSGLTQILKTAGFSPTAKDGKVQFRLQEGGWAFPTVVRVDVERDRLVCQLALIELNRTAEIDQAKLLGLLSVDDPSRGAFFAFDRAEEMLLLRASLSNRSVVASEIARELKQLATIAGEKSELWSNLIRSGKTPSPKSQPEPTRNQLTQNKLTQNGSTQNPPAAKPPRTNASGRPNGSKVSLLGRFSASLSATEAFAIQISDNNRFQLAHVKAGKSTVSKGTLVRNGDRVSLRGDDGTTLNCVVQSQMGGFRLGILGADGKTAVNLNFLKQ